MGHHFCYFLIVSGQSKWDLNKFLITYSNFQAYGCFEGTVSVSCRLYLGLLFLDTCDDKQISTLIVRIKLLQKSCFVCFDINKRYDIG